MDERNAESAWLVWSNEHQQWWAPDAKGYTSKVDEAGRYTLAQACNHSHWQHKMPRPDEVVVPSPEWITRAVEAEAERDKLRIQLAAADEGLLKVDGLRTKFRIFCEHRGGYECGCPTCDALRVNLYAEPIAALTPTAKEPAND